MVGVASPLVALPAPGIDLLDVGDEMLAYDGTALTLLSGAEVPVVRRADGIRAVRDVEVASELASRGILALTPAEPVERYRRPDRVGFCEDGDHLVFVELATGRQHVLTPSASEVWWQLVEAGTLAGALAGLEASFPEVPELADEARAFVDDLVDRGLVERVVD